MVIIAGSVGVQTPTGIDTRQLSDFSDKAGIGANSYLAALGYNDLAPDNTGREYLWSGTSFSAPTISGAVALMAQAFPNLSGEKIVQILFNSADDLGEAGVDVIFGHGRMNLARAFQPTGATSLAGGQTPVSLAGNGDLPGAAGDAASAQSLGAVILDGYDRAYVLNLAATLRRADVDHPLSRSLQNGLKVSSGNAGPVSIAMTVRERHDLTDGFAIEQAGVGPEDLRKSRLIAASAVARVDDRTAVAFGFADGAKAMERRLNHVSASGSFLVAGDISANPGFTASRDGSIALRRQFGGTGVTLSAESGNVWQDVKTSATGAPYRWTSVALDRKLGASWLSFGVSRLDERQSLLGGRLGNALGGGGSTSLFLDGEARHEFGGGWSAALNARRGWTDFASGRFQTGAYALDFAKVGVLGASDKLALRLAQPLRVEHGGFAMWLPTAYDYTTGIATDSLTRMSLRPTGRELDGELSYGSSLMAGRAWFGGNLFYRRDPGHIASSPDDVGGAIRFTLGF
jgi:hypothetical protein